MVLSAHVLVCRCGGPAAQAPTQQPAPNVLRMWCLGRLRGLTPTEEVVAAAAAAAAAAAEASCARHHRASRDCVECVFALLPHGAHAIGRASAHTEV